VSGPISIIIDKLTNSIEQLSTGIHHDTAVVILAKSDLKLTLKKNGWLFRWKDEYAQEGREVYKLFIADDEDHKIQGLISIEVMQDHVYIHLIENAPHNRNKEDDSYIGVGGNLVAHACRRSVKEGCEGFVAMTAKTDLINHYEKTLGAEHFKDGRMIIPDVAAQVLIKKYKL